MRLEAAGGEIAMKHILRVMFKGLVVVLPIGLTIYVFWWLATSVESLLRPLMVSLLPEQGLLRYQPGMGILAAVVLIFLIGLLTYGVLFRRLFKVMDLLMERLPLLGSVYGGVRDLMDMMSRSTGGNQLGQVVSVEIAGDMRLIGFITQREEGIPEAFRGESGDDEQTVAVYLPMSYQIGGFTIFLPKRCVQPVDMRVEEAMRYALTAGMSTQRQSPVLDETDKGK
jgi:uncharacterized membrane protein